MSLSNMPIRTSESMSGGSWMRDNFHPTPPMSTYLLAFVVGDLRFNSKVTENNLKVRKINIHFTCKYAGFFLHFVLYT